jgi:hypothetical protein
MWAVKWPNGVGRILSGRAASRIADFYSRGPGAGFHFSRLDKSGITIGGNLPA